ncbi:MAG: hydantoinase/oxoprolinase family protein [Longimicrobiales bacterium]|nr:hydantoinase/oxoprolinase family protein [Longimicrobiales bacterium]
MSIIAVDTGGTFTDVVAVVDGRLTVLKVPSTPDDPARAVLDGIRRVRAAGDTDADRSSSFTLVHGSTVATNTLLERTGARVALVTNRGFEDIIEIGRQNRPQLYAIVGHRPEPLVAREDRHGVAGRLGPAGEEVAALDPDEIQGLTELLADAESVAVCLLHSYADPAHEDRVAEALEGLGVPVSVSSRLLPEYREYERTATTVINAYIAPRMDTYLGRLDRDAGADRIRIMGSGGGAIPVARARREAVHTVLSGPAGGVVGALRVAGDAELRDIITFDMGGTSTDVSLCPGAPQRTREFGIAGVPVAIPVIDIHTVGAGGGSIAWVDAGGALRVGPRSAGADPGPICYGRGGTAVTVTDAHVWLGRLPPDVFLGGRNRLDRSAIEAPLSELADELGGTLYDAAEGVLAVADTAMEGALRVISVERGHDPADFALVPFGGAAGLHAVELASRLGIRRLLVPPDPGVLSAYGMLVSPVRKDVSRTVLLGPGDPGIASVYASLESGARGAVEAEGLDPAEVAFRRLADVRYAGQSFELRVPADDWPEAFHDAHEARYGFARRDAAVELVTARVEAVGPTPTVPVGERRPPDDGRTSGPARRRPAEITVRYQGDVITGRAIARTELEEDEVVTGPAVVHEYSATLWLPPGWQSRASASGALIVEPA